MTEVTKTVPLEKLVWGHRKEPDNERQEIHTIKEKLSEPPPVLAQGY